MSNIAICVATISVLMLRTLRSNVLQSPSVWTDGSILDPNDGKTYRLSATYELDGTLRARIFVGVPIFGKTEILKRIDTKSLPGLC
jgi:uncharacterized protein (DUF2147 family)